MCEGRFYCTVKVIPDETCGISINIVGVTFDAENNKTGLWYKPLLCDYIIRTDK